MSSQFDQFYNRKNGGSYKWDSSPVKSDNLIAMSVADMDWPLAKDIEQGLMERVKGGIFGYDAPPANYYDSVINWMKRRHQWDIKKDWIILTSGVVMSINVAVQSLTNKGDAIIIMSPVYYPFSMAVVKNDRQLITTSLVQEEDHYDLDFEDFEKKIVDNDVKMLIFCHPHNPIGKAWTREELKQIGDICQKHDVYVVSDEIHMDFVYAPKKHIPFVSVDPSFEEFTITCTAASKSFNLAGFYTSNIVIPNNKIRKMFQAGLERNGASHCTNLGMAATALAYEKCEDWFDEVHHYIEDNIHYMDNYLKNNIPVLKMTKTESLYLTWVDCRELGMDDQALNDFMLNKAHLFLDEGVLFGQEGSGFMRFNLACPRVTLEKALNQLKIAVESL
ncbi:MAG: pyridoxal phosphate-dependent aminotransferase [Erysipelotrichaceae bacterium]|nr:pyridoxal phosphate-dependent aminotransferase [Erysipelotrichaceae bacterium]